MRKLLAFSLILPLALAPAIANAASDMTARASGNIALVSGPGGGGAVAKLADGEAVHLETCTKRSEWCLVDNPHGPNGWARGGDLVGWAAKMEVSPPDGIRENNAG